MIDPDRPDYGNTPISSRRPLFEYAPLDAAAPACVSIVTPFFNSGAVFDETARSVLRQSLQSWEWIVVNDQSTDPASLDVLARYRQLDPRIRVIDLDGNLGPAGARNVGYRAARTPYVLQLDSDDLLEPTAAEKWWWCLESYPEYAFAKGYSVGFGAQEYLWRSGFHDGSALLTANRVDANCLIRRSVHEAVGGYDEANREGLEDWAFWVECAARGHWGTTIPEFLDWYRRRGDHGRRWANWDGGPAERRFRARLQARHPHLWNGGFPKIPLRQHMPNEDVPDELPASNLLTKRKRRALLVLPWLTMGGSDRFNLDLLEDLTTRGWEVTIVTTLPGDHAWLPLFARFTPDVFPLHHFLRLRDYPRFLRYLTASRRPDLICVSNSELGYLLLPFLRAHAPDATYVDFCHMEEEHWKNGGYPRLAVEYQQLLDLNMVSSQHLKTWMTSRGADPDRIQVCYTGGTEIPADTVRAERVRVRRRLGIRDDAPVVLYAARLCEQKQPVVFAQTILLLRSRLPGLVAMVAGDGPDEPWLREFVARHRVGSAVRLLGRQPPDIVGELMSASDVCFLPSKGEGIALAAYEAMSRGVAVVSTDVGGQRELVTADCGLLLPAAAGPDEFARALEDLFRDRSRLRELGRNARSRVERHFAKEGAFAAVRAAFDTAASHARTDPRPTVSPELGRICARQAVEYCRLHDLADRLWLATYTAGSATPATGWRASLFRAFTVLEPAYAWGLRQGWAWLPSARRRIRDALRPGV